MATRWEDLQYVRLLQSRYVVGADRESQARTVTATLDDRDGSTVSERDPKDYLERSSWRLPEVSRPAETQARYTKDEDVRSLGV